MINVIKSNNENMTSLIKLINVGLFLFHLLCGRVNCIQTNLDDNLFRFRWLSKEILEDTPGYEKLDMLTADNEKFQCLIPIDDFDTKENEKIYNGPNELQVIRPLFDLKSCTVMMLNFWSYELCHGKSITQFHIELDSPDVRHQEYSLGVFTPQNIKDLEEELSKQSDEMPSPDKPKVNIDGVLMPYFQMEYVDGTPCDITGRPRRSRVRYVCNNQAVHVIYSVKEVYTCEYEIVVLTFYLCRHPYYRSNEPPQTNLDCVPLESEVKKPRNLQQIETDNIRMQAYLFTLENDLEKGILVDKSIPEFTPKEYVEFNDKKTAPRMPKVSADALLLDQFLLGEFCLHGVSDFWQYEFCYGKYVRQYRQHSKNIKTTVRLGDFDLEEHKAWVKTKQSKSKQSNSVTHSVSHFYSGGDYCDDIKAKRSVEVRLKCVPSASSWTLSLVEPKVCRYVLNVESPLLCSLMDQVDEWNMFTRQLREKSEDGKEASKSKSRDEKSSSVIDFAFDEEKPPNSDDLSPELMEEDFDDATTGFDLFKESLSELIERVIEKSKPVDHDNDDDDDLVSDAHSGEGYSEDFADYVIRSTSESKVSKDYIISEYFDDDVTSRTSQDRESADDATSRASNDDVTSRTSQVKDSDDDVRKSTSESKDSDGDVTSRASQDKDSDDDVTRSTSERKDSDNDVTSRASQDRDSDNDVTNSRDDEL